MKKNVNEEAKITEPAGEEKKLNVESLIEKGKNGKLSQSDLDEALEEMNYDVDRIDALYETLEDHGIAFENDIFSKSSKNCSFLSLCLNSAKILFVISENGTSMF